MAKVSFSKLNLKIKNETLKVEIAEGVELDVQNYLPQSEKGEFIQYVLTNALDETTGSMSPLRIETFFMLGIMQYYTNIHFTANQLSNPAKLYDILETNGIFDIVRSAIPETEIEYLEGVTIETATDIARFNSSFAGTLTMMQGEAGMLGTQLDEILTNVRNKEGLELLDEIKNINGRD